MAGLMRDVTDAELAVLRALWDGGPGTVRNLADLIYGEDGPRGASRSATVQKLLERLEAKGCVRRRRGEGSQVFEAAVARDDLIGHRLREVAEKLCDGSLTPLLTHLVAAEPLSRRDREALRALIDRLDGQKAGRVGDKG